MANRGALKISTILQALFGVLIAAIAGSLALPIYGAWQQRARNGEVVEFARAGYCGVHRAAGFSFRARADARGTRHARAGLAVLHRGER